MGSATSVPGGRARAAKSRSGPRSKSGRGFPPEYKALSPSGKLSWLGSEAAAAIVESGRLHRNQLEAEADRLEKERVKIGAVVPSPARLDEYSRTGLPFPPKADDPASQMRRADRTLSPCEAKTLWPAAYLSGPDGGVVTYDVTVWDDCRRRAAIEGGGVRSGGTESPSAAGIAAAMESRTAVVELKMEPEDDDALQRYIDRFVATARAVTV